MFSLGMQQFKVKEKKRGILPSSLLGVTVNESNLENDFIRTVSEMHVAPQIFSMADVVVYLWSIIPSQMEV